jgi:hypothetical protein
MGAIHSCREFSGIIINPEKLISTGHCTLVSQFKIACDALTVPVLEESFEFASPELIGLITGSLVDLAKMEGRTRLLLAGAYIEDQVLVCALTALAEGFDVFLLMDLLVAKGETSKSSSERRLYSLGVVPTTFDQVLYQWHAAEDATEKRQLILERLRALIGAPTR